MRIQSNDIVLLDTTDSKKIDLHITSNHPTVQIYDQNTSQGTLTPDWSTNPLELTPTVYVDSTDITNELTNFVWTKIKGSNIVEEQVGTSKVLRISTNDLNASATVRYKCTVKYNGKSFSNEITFARVSTGKNGADGNSAPTVKAQYSVNGTSNWATTLDSSVHKYIRFSYDNGATWTTAIKIAGEDGKSVEIKGVAYAKTTPVTGQTIVLYSDTATTTQITNATEGDSYLVNGYLCVYNGTNFVCTGQIQGPPGQKGDSYYLFIRYADNANGGGISTTPNGKTYIGFYRSSVNQVPTDVSATTWNWSKFVGDNAKSINLTANAQVFKVDKSNAISPTTITVTAQVINTTIPSNGWTYSIDGGKTFTSTLPAGVARSGNVVTLTGTGVTENSIVIKASDGTYSDVFTIYKAIDGTDGLPGDDGTPAPIAFLSNENISFVANANGQVASTTVYCNVVAYNGTTKVTPTIGVVTGAPSGMTISPNKGIAYSNITPTVGNLTVTDLYISNSLTTKIDKTKLVNGDSFIVGDYLYIYNATNSNFKCETITIGGVEELSKCVVNNEIVLGITIANNATLGGSNSISGAINIPITSPVATTLKLNWSKINTGAPGVSIRSTTVTYGVSDSASTRPADNAWQSTIPVVAEGKYLWTRTIIDYTDDIIADTVTYTYAKQGTIGETGSSGTSVTVSSIQYKEGTSATTAPTGTWSDSVVPVSEGKYLWTKTAFSDGKIAYGVAKQGVSGKDGVGINSTTVDYGVSDSAAIKPTTWQQNIPVVSDGEYLWTRTITDYTDASKPDTITYVYAKQGAKGDTGTAGSSVTVKSIKYQAGTSATTAPTGTWSDSVVEVTEGNYLWTQTTFSDNKVAYGVAKQGQRGAQGIQGPKGNDGQQYYTWVKYADTPTSGMSDDPTNKIYIGLAYNKTTATESTTYSDYAWSLIRGATGAVGPKGEDGQQYYTWIKYADNVSGANMSDLPDGKSYIGLAYNKTTSTESNTASDYTWALFKGDKGANGTNASLVDITPSALYFKSTTGKDGTFTPDYIYLYPRFQTVTFSKWEYSVNGGITWIAASGANGITISTYSSVANTLRIAKTSTLYTDTVTSISFRCVSSNASVYDTVSIGKLFDVDVEEINTRITNSLAEVKTTTDSIASRVSATETSITTINNNVTSLTTRVSTAEQKITADAIVSTVTKSTTYTNDLGKKVGTNEIISKINQTAETITISANKIGLLGATNIPDLTADKIKGGTLTLGGSSATTQNGQLLVKNASNVDMLKVNKDGIVVKSGHLAVAEDFANQTYNWDTDTWTTTTNTSQLDLSDNSIRMGVYSSTGYTNYMTLLYDGLSFQGIAQGVGSWSSFVGHDTYGDFVIQDSERGNIYFRGQGDAELANISGDGFYINTPAVFNGGISYISIPANSNLNNYKTTGFYKCTASATAATITNCPTVSAFGLTVEAHAGVKQTLTVYFTDNKPIIYVRNFYNNAWGAWSRLCYAGEHLVLWSGVTGVGSTITLKESFRNFKFLTCMIGTTTEPYGIALGSFIDPDVAELHFSASFTATNGKANNNVYGAKFTASSGTSVKLVGCGTIETANLSLRKIVGWR